jgi:hypothetical protein
LGPKEFGVWSLEFGELIDYYILSALSSQLSALKRVVPPKFIPIYKGSTLAFMSNPRIFSRYSLSADSSFACG